MILQWFLSRQARHALAMRKHVHKILEHQRDLLAPRAIEEVELAMRAVRDAVTSKAPPDELQKQVENLEKAADKWLRPYPNATWRENVEVLLVALTVAMGIRTFFLQPFKIPTGSMQPTLFGVTSVPDFSKGTSANAQSALRDKLDFPTGWDRVKEWFHGVSYLHIVAQEDGELRPVDPPLRILIFNIKQTIWVGNRSYTLWFPPDYGSATLDQRAGIQVGQLFHKGDDIVKMKVQAGDHLFVNRLTFNFCPPQRGDIVVFETKGIPEEERDRWNHIPDDQFYIKRLVGLGGETISLQKDYNVLVKERDAYSGVGHLVVDGQPITASTPHFDNLYTFYGARPGTDTLVYQENQYFGHALLYSSDDPLHRPLSLSGTNSFQIRTNYYFVMGDNTMNSLDSRYWGDFPSTSVIGEAFFVYWPITKRFGWGQH